MHRISFISIALCTIWAACSMPALAQPISQAFTYQGRLLDAGGPASGQYDLEFRLFDLATQGLQLGPTVAKSNVTIAEGMISETLDFGDQFKNETIWLEIRIRRVGTPDFTTLLPRQPLTPTPFASQAIEATFALDAPISLDDAYAYGNAIIADQGPVQIIGDLDLGEPAAVDGRFQVFSAAGPIRTLAFDNFAGRGGRMRLGTPQGGLLASLGPDLTGNAADFYAAGGDNPTSGLLWEGSVGASGGGRLSITGPASAARFNTNRTGDASVILPEDAISAPEILDEPGVAAYSGVLFFSIGGTPETILERSIVVPADGFVVAIVTLEVGLSRSASDATVVSFELSLDPDPAGFTQRYAHEYPPGFPTTPPFDVSQFYSLHSAFAVSAGEATVYLHADSTGATMQLYDYEMTLLYFPTSYAPASGAAALTAPGQAAWQDSTHTVRTPADPIAAEIEDLRRQVAELRALIESKAD